MEKNNKTKISNKILLLGDSSVGKTSIILMYTKKKINTKHITTIGLDYATKEEKLKDGTIITLQIWDTAGQERFHSITKKLYKTSNGLLLIYDITSLNSFKNINIWLEQIKNENNENIQIILVGNKKDLENKREVSYSDGEKLAKSYGIDFYEVSALNNDGIDKIFHKIAVLLSGINNNYQDSIILDRKSHQSRNKELNKNDCCLFKKKKNEKNDISNNKDKI